MQGSLKFHHHHHHHHHHPSMMMIISIMIIMMTPLTQRGGGVARGFSFIQPVAKRSSSRILHPHYFLPTAFAPPAPRLFFSSSSATATTSTDNKSNTKQQQPQPVTYNGTITILERGPHHFVVAKPPSVLCHHSDWAGSRQKKKSRGEPEIPMLQLMRQASGRRVNLIHRLDRGTSGCLLCTYADDNDDSANNNNTTAILSEAMSSSSTTKTYVALVRGEGILHGRDFTKEGWFTINRPIKNERGILKEATTQFRFLAGQSADDAKNQPRASIVLARPQTGRWHQIRRHLNGISHPIIGDSTHGNSKINREWKTKRGMPSERTCLHLAQIQMNLNNTVLGKSESESDGTTTMINVTCPIPQDMMLLLENHLPNLLHNVKELLREEEGIGIDPSLLFSSNMEGILEDDEKEEESSSKKKKKNGHEVLPYEITI